MATVIEERASGSSTSLQEKIDSEKAQGKLPGCRMCFISNLIPSAAPQEQVAITEFDDPNIDKDAVVFGVSIALHCRFTTDAGCYRFFRGRLPLSRGPIRSSKY